MSDLINKQELIAWVNYLINHVSDCKVGTGTFKDGLMDGYCRIRSIVKEFPSAQPERLTDDDFETIRIHLNAYKEKLCNQQRWKEAEEYQRIIDRFMTFASAQPDVPDMNVGDIISRQAAIDAISCNIIVTGRQNAELVAATIGAFADRIKALPSVQLPEVLEAYYKGKCDGIKECTARLKKVNEEFVNG